MKESLYRSREAAVQVAIQKYFQSLFSFFARYNDTWQRSLPCEKPILTRITTL